MFFDRAQVSPTVAVRWKKSLLVKKRLLFFCFFKRMVIETLSEKARESYIMWETVSLTHQIGAQN